MKIQQTLESIIQAYGRNSMPARMVFVSNNHDDIDLERDSPGTWISEILRMDELCGEAV